MQVIFYNNTSNPHVMSKAIAQIGSFNCNVKEPNDVERPEIYLAHDDSIDHANYCYIADFGRYYYCKALPQLGQTMRFTCESDPLMSFRSGILASPAVISRNPWHFDLYVPDPKLPIEARSAGAVLKFPGTHFSGSNNSYILTTIGSG
jgi:hypothetical protein